MNNHMHVIQDLELRKIFERQLRINLLDKEIEEEKDHELLLGKLEARHEISKIQITEMLRHLQKKTQEYTTFVNEANNSIVEVSKALEEIDKENDVLYDKLCFLMLVNPREAFELIFKNVEKREKLKDGSGSSWEWPLKFNFLARLRMAARLIFG